MPRNTRNFWLEADIDGRRTTLEGGPRSRDGGFSATFYIRDNGSVLRAVTVYGIARSDGTLSVDVSAASDIAHSTTGRIEPDETGGFSVKTQSGRKPPRAHPEPEPLAPWERELLRQPEQPAPVPEYDPDACRYLLNLASTRENCRCDSCWLVLAKRQERERQEYAEPGQASNPFGMPFETNDRPDGPEWGSPGYRE